MYLIKRINGVFYVEYKDKSGKKKRISTENRDKHQAEIFLSEFRDKFQKEKVANTTNTEPIKTTQPINPIPSNSIKVKDFFVQYKSYVDTFKSKKYARLVQITIEFFNAKFENRALTELSNREIEMILITKYSFSKYSATAHYRNLRAAFNKAIEWDYISKNPLSKIKLPKIPQNIPKFINESELQMINDKAKSKYYSNIFTMAYYTGMRRSEIINLKWTEVDLNNKIIHITNTTNFNTKNKKDRFVPMHPVVFELLSSLYPKRISDYALPKSNGFPFSKDVITAQFKISARAAKLDHRIHFHSLRHSFASNLVRKGAPLIVVKELLGHEDITTTMVYSHTRRDDLVNAVQLL